MQYVWEASDVRLGRRVKSNSEEYIISYKVPSFPDKGNLLYLCSLFDGMIFLETKTKEDFAEQLNTFKYLPVDI